MGGQRRADQSPSTRSLSRHHPDPHNPRESLNESANRRRCAPKGRLIGRVLPMLHVLQMTPFGVAASAQSAPSKSVPLMSTLSGAVDSEGEASSLTRSRRWWHGVAYRASGRDLCSVPRSPLKCDAVSATPEPGDPASASPQAVTRHLVASRRAAGAASGPICLRGVEGHSTKTWGTCGCDDWPRGAHGLNGS